MILGNYISSTISNLKRIIKIYAFGKDDVRTASQYGPAGFDSSPISGMKAIYAKTNRSTEPVIVGYLSKAEVKDGESKMFSFDSSSDLAYVFCDKNGYLELNGGDDFAVAFNNLKTEFNELQGKVNDMINSMSAWTPTAQDGGAALKTALFTTPPKVSASTANINNAKVLTVRLP